MSKVFSFRLSEDSPRVAQASEVIQTWRSQGYSLRYIITEALIHFRDKNNHQNERIDIVLKQFTQLLEQIENRHESAKVELSKDVESSASFVESIIESVKPGVKMNQFQHTNR